MQPAYAKADTGRWIEDTGFVRRLLQDDDELIAHNIDVAERIPLSLGDRIHFRGMYEWNDLGGLVHWTHHDPLGEEDGGWVRYRRKVYA
jgi:hypothetical protein